MNDLKQIVSFYNDYCTRNSFSMQDNINYVKEQIVTTEPDSQVSLYDICHDSLYNDRADILKPLLEDLAVMMIKVKDIEDCSPEEESILCYPGITDCRDMIQEKYNVLMLSEEGDARVCFVFDEFVIKCDKSYYSSQTDDEYTEYLTTIANVVNSGITKTHALMPVISFVDVNDITFEIFPRAVTDPYQPSDEWFIEQNRLRYLVLDEGINLKESDIYCTNLGLYRGELYIIDAGSIHDINVQTGYKYKEYA